MFSLGWVHHFLARMGQQSSGWADRGCLLSGYCSLAIGSSVLLGWSSGIEILKRIDPSFVAMNPVTAWCFILSGSALLAHQFRFRRAAVGSGTVVAIISAAKIGDLLWGIAPVDQLLFSGLLDTGRGSHPNRMAPNTAVAFFFVGIALIFVGSKHRAPQLLSQSLAVGVLLISMFALVGYAFGIDQLTGIGPFIPMALHTGLALIVVAVGVLLLTRETGLMVVLRDRGPAGSLARSVLPLAIAVPVAVGAARLWGQHNGYYGTEAGVALTAMANVVVTSALLISSILALHRSDCTRKDREHALRQSEQFNRTINQASPDAVSLLDVNGVVLFSNHAALRAYGLDSTSELIGRPWGDRLDSSVHEERDAALAMARAGGVGQITLCLPGSQGEPRWFESLVSELPEVEGQRFRFIVMSRDITRQKRVENEVRWTATHDALTRLPNRALFQARLEELTEASCSPDFALLLLDVDDFKQVNDTLGHDAGDALLCAVGERLRNAVRQEDFVARLGGDEFAIILERGGSEAGVTAAAAKIFEALREPWIYNGRVADCRVSIGASIAPRDGEESSKLLKNADIALYAAKIQDRGRIAVFEPAMRAAMQERSSKLSLARHALQENLIVPYYQPKVELRSGKLIGFEALLRWRHPRRGIQLPASIDAAFEDHQLAREITECILGQAVFDMRRWQDEGLDFGHVAINASAADFKDEGFADRLLEHLQTSSIPTTCVQIEVTETVFLGRGAEYVERALKTLSANGIGIALDDFGTGYASLSHLKQFPVDIVKIDRSFLSDVQKNAESAAIIKTVLSLGRSLDLDVVAEGVETAGQESYLVSQGCQFGQGYLYGKATAANHVPGLISSWGKRPSQAA